MLENIASSWPIIPGSVAVVLGAIATLGGLLMLRDVHAFDTSCWHKFGLALIGIGIVGWFLMGVWNLGATLVLLKNQPDTYAAIAPVPRE